MRPYKTSIIATHNPKVAGSSPVPATSKPEPFKKLGGFFY